uniref:Solute carrier family 13 member 2 n=1 Tax=Araneus ventricosus TaxID=182803 RepID=A0A4Y2UKC9_ARAVE|nr:Solute carrier family 13 member 2 [Araneus ventricosus]
MTFIGGLMAAIAIENCKLHERIALKVLLLVGTEVKGLLLGIMLTTMFLSMWMSNSATTALMVPIVNVLAGEISPNTKEIHLDEGISVIENNEIYRLEENAKKRNSIKE